MADYSYKRFCNTYNKLIADNVDINWIRIGVFITDKSEHVIISKSLNDDVIKKLFETTDNKNVERIKEHIIQRNIKKNNINFFKTIKTNIPSTMLERLIMLDRY